MSGDGELMLTILASFAQAEAESVSENCRWRIKKNFESGIPVGVFMYGYKMKNGTFTIIPEEAEIIRLIFKLFLEGMGRVAIANYLNQKGVPAPEGGKWHPGMLYFILRNEKYVGDLVLQKYYTKDYLTKKKMVNHGERPFYFIDDNHEGILDHGVFDQVTEERCALFNRDQLPALWDGGRVFADDGEVPVRHLPVVVSISNIHWTRTEQKSR